MLLPQDQWEAFPTRDPRVWASNIEWITIPHALLKADIAEVLPSCECKTLRGRRLVHGCSGVGKSGFAVGEGPQRFVVNMPLGNALLKQLDGDMSKLPLLNH